MQQGVARNILLINQPWLIKELKLLGYEVRVAAGKNSDVPLKERPEALSSILKRLGAFVPDCLVYWDNGGPMTVIGIEKAQFATVFYSVDVHKRTDLHQYFAACFDFVLFAQSDYFPTLSTYAEAAQWMPLWSHHVADFDQERTIPVSFRGTLHPGFHPKRRQFFESVAKSVSVDFAEGPYAPCYARSKIVLNQAIRRDVNFRVFEAMACGALVITPNICNGQDELFEEGRDYILYKDNSVEDAVEKITYFLAHEEKRKQIARRGYAKAVAMHLSLRRAKQLDHVFKFLAISKRTHRFLGAGVSEILSALLYQDILKEVPSRLIQNGMRNLILHSSTLGTQTLMYDYCVLRAMQLCRGRYSPKDVLDVFTAWYQAAPQNLMVQLSYISLLKQVGDRSAAELTAERHFPNPAEVVELIDQIIEQNFSASD